MTITLLVKQSDPAGFVTDAEPVTFKAQHGECHHWLIGDHVRRNGRVFTVTRRTWEENGDLVVNVMEVKP